VFALFEYFKLFSCGRSRELADFFVEKLDAFLFSLPRSRLEFERAVRLLFSRFWELVNLELFSFIIIGLLS
jgi:hypothetical protein